MIAARGLRVDDDAAALLALRLGAPSADFGWTAAGLGPVAVPRGLGGGLRLGIGFGLACDFAAGLGLAFAFGFSLVAVAAAEPEPAAFSAARASDSSTFDWAAFASTPAALRAASSSLLVVPCAFAIS